MIGKMCRDEARAAAGLAIALLVSCCLILVGYVPNAQALESNQDAQAGETSQMAFESADDASGGLEFSGMDSDELLEYVSNTMYADIANSLGDGENTNLELVDVHATYLSHEYVEEVSYNSQSNIFFGYTLDELSDAFDGSRYLFSLSDDGMTQVEPLEQDSTTSYEQMIDNVDSGAGVVLLAATFAIPAVSAVSAGGAAIAAGAGAADVVRAIFSVGATSPANVALTTASAGDSLASLVKAAARGDTEAAAVSAVDTALSIVPVQGAGKCAALVGKVAEGSEKIASTSARAAKNAAQLSDKLISSTKDIEIITKNTINQTEKNGVKYIWKYVTLDNGKIVKGNFPQFDSKCNVILPSELHTATDYNQFKYCSNVLKEQIQKNKINKNIFNDEQLEQIMDDETPSGFTWHHNEETGLMQLVDSKTHESVPHTGGRAIWGGGSSAR